MLGQCLKQMLYCEIKISMVLGDSLCVECGICWWLICYVVFVFVVGEGQEKWWDYYWIDMFEIVQCGGCEIIFFRKYYVNSEDMMFDGDYFVEEVLFFYGVGSWVLILDENLFLYKVCGIYIEMVGVFNSLQFIFVGIGV